MKDNEDLKFFNILQSLLIFLFGFCIAIIIFFFYGICTVDALEVKEPDYTSGSLWYGYKLPDRVSNNDTTYNYVSVGITNNNGLLRYQNNLRFRYQNQNYVQNAQTDIWTDYIDSDWLLNNDTSADYLTLAYHYGDEFNTLDDMLINGFGLDYSQKYSYSFYIEVYNYQVIENAVLHLPSFDCFINKSASGAFVCNTTRFDSNNTSERLLNITNVYDDGTRAVFQYDVTHYNPSANIHRFNEVGFTYDNSLNWRFQTRGFGSSIVGGINQMDVYDLYGGATSQYKKYKFRISQPFNLVLWSNNSSLTCSTTCWTQSQTEENNSFLDNNMQNREKNLIESLFGLDFFNDFGLSNVIINFINNIRNVVSHFYSASNSCYNLNFNILGQPVSISCGRSFWNRNDISSFLTIWNMVWIVFIGFGVARAMYYAIVSLFDIDEDISKEVKERYTL